MERKVVDFGQDNPENTQEIKGVGKPQYKAHRSNDTNFQIRKKGIGSQKVGSNKKDKTTPMGD